MMDEYSEYRERRIKEITKELDRMDDNNDGSLSWVDDRRALINELSELEGFIT